MGTRWLHKGSTARELDRILPMPIDEDEVKRLLAARPPWETQWFEVDGETAASLKPGGSFQGGVVERIEAAVWPTLRLFVLVSNLPEAPP